jgi:FKBP-type peptidyl-prolyl cis-trans isomerase SlyD
MSNTIQNDKVVSIHYDVHDTEGNLIDSSKGGDPLSYIHGKMHIIPGLEKALNGKAVGDALNATIKPEEAYGERSESMVQSVPKTELSSIENLQVGMHIEAESDQGPIVLEVIEIKDNDVILDGNHPLAGKTLKFDVKVIDIRDASEEELKCDAEEDDESCGCSCSCSDDGCGK